MAVPCLNAPCAHQDDDHHPTEGYCGVVLSDAPEAPEHCPCDGYLMMVPPDDEGDEWWAPPRDEDERGCSTCGGDPNWCPCTTGWCPVRGMLW